MGSTKSLSVPRAANDGSQYVREDLRRRRFGGCVQRGEAERLPQQPRDARGQGCQELRHRLALRPLEMRALERAEPRDVGEALAPREPARGEESEQQSQSAGGAPCLQRQGTVDRSRERRNRERTAHQCATCTDDVEQPERRRVGAEQQVLAVVERRPSRSTRRARPPSTGAVSYSVHATPRARASTAAAQPA